MKKLIVLAVVSFCMLGCGTRIDVPVGTSVQYENAFVGSKVVVGKQLADEIIAKLNDEPDSAERGVGMGLKTKKYLRIGKRTFQVTEHVLVLLDDWGVRNWKIKDIETRLEALIESGESKANTDASPESSVLNGIVVGMSENALLTKLEPNIKRSAILTYGGTGNHALYLELAGKKQIAFEIDGPYRSEWAKVRVIGQVEELEDWSKYAGIEINPDSGDGK